MQTKKNTHLIPELAHEMLEERKDNMNCVIA